MAKVLCSVDEDYVDTDYGNVYGVRVTCDRCGHSVEVGGTEEASIKRGASTLRDECPRGESNFYSA